MHGIILAGGKGSRFRPDKLLLPVGGVPVIQRVIDALKSVVDSVSLVANVPDRFRFLGVPIIPDQEVDCGPLMGLYSGLLKAPCEWSLVVAGDMPFLKPALLKFIAKITEQTELTAVVLDVDGMLHPLLACYSKRFITLAKAAMEKGVQSIRIVLQGNSYIIGRDEWGAFDPEGDSFISVNTLEEYEKAQEITKG